MKAILSERGHQIVDDYRDANAIIVNTCAVRSDSEQKSLKLINKLRTENPKAKLIVAGCLAEANPYSILKEFPEATLISPYRILEVADALDGGDKLRLGFSDRKRGFIPKILDGAIGIVPINDGCLGDCSFCITKRARRALLSRSPHAIISAVGEMVSSGAREIQLASQDAGAYGVDISGRKLLPRLLTDLNEKVSGKYLVRVAMMNPDTILDILDELVESFRLEHIYKFAHIPLQSGNDEVLKLMNRKYTVDDYLYIVQKLKKEIPNISVATDIMVGHPGEDDDAFNETLKLVKSGIFDRIHVAQYTPRPFTASARMDQVSDGIKKERSKMLIEAHSSLSLERMKRYVGEKMRGFILESNSRRKSVTLRTENYISVVAENNGSYKIGDEVLVRIKAATFFDLRGEIIEKIS